MDIDRVQVDGRPIKNVNFDEVKLHADEIRKRNLTAVIVVGVFSPLDTTETPQEEQVKHILKEKLPDVDVVCSRDIGRVGFLERENASILNGSMLKFARKTIRGFQDAVHGLALSCPVYLTQNDGTVMDTTSAAMTPIKTFSSGATVSLPTKSEREESLTKTRTP